MQRLLVCSSAVSVHVFEMLYNDDIYVLYLGGRVAGAMFDWWWKVVRQPEMVRSTRADSLVM